MEINKSLISNNNSYENNNPKYIVIHNTGNPGKGANAKAHATAQYNKSWSGGSAHVYVDGESAFQAMPYNRGAWHVGVNYGGRLFGTVNNRNSIGIEMCIEAGYNYEKSFKNTVTVCKQLMKEFNIPAENVVTHFDVCNKNCPQQIREHGDWELFKKLISEKKTSLYRVRKGWKNKKSQIGAYESLENAKKNCPVGYYVYDEKGHRVWGNPKAGLQAEDLAELKTDEFIEKVGKLFTTDQRKSGILASVSMAQFILESGWCESELAKKANNCFGMKKNLSGNTWKGSSWDGKSVISMQTGEETEKGEHITITAEFRKYPDIARSIADHSAYLNGAKNGKKLRYAGLRGELNYKKAIKIIKNGGYATDSNYEKEICRIIEQYNLTRFNFKSSNTQPQASKPSKPSKPKELRVKVNSDHLRIRTGAGIKYKWTGKYTGKGIFTITEIKGDWGKLKSGAGWICVNMSCVHKLLV